MEGDGDVFIPVQPQISHKVVGVVNIAVQGKVMVMFVPVQPQTSGCQQHVQCCTSQAVDETR